MFFPERLDLHIHAGRQVELHQRVHRVLRRLQDVDQALVRADLKCLARLLVHVRGAQHAIFVLHRGQRNRSGNLRPGTFGRINNLARGLVQDAIVVRFQPYANSLFTYQCRFPQRSSAVRPVLKDRRSLPLFDFDLRIVIAGRPIANHESQLHLTELSR